MSTIIFTLIGAIGFYLMLSAGYLLLMSIASRFFKSVEFEATHLYRRVALFIPAYKEDAVIVDVAKHALQQNYPAELMEVIVIADQLKAETIHRLRKLNVTVVEVSFEQSTKSKALRAALKACSDRYFDVAVVLDADNIMSPDFLSKVHQAFDQGVCVLQGRRVARNMDTPTAVMDAWSEEVNNAIFSAGQRLLGLSSRLAGSGMAFDFQLFQSVMQGVNAIGGFDKELELKLIRMGHKVHYLQTAKVYDEKVSDTQVLTRQRSMWIAAQFHYARLYFPVACFELLTRFKLDFFNKAFQMILPPRMVLPVALMVLSAVYYLLGFKDAALLAACFLLLNLLAYLIATPAYLMNMKLLSSMKVLPQAIWRLLPALLRLGEANKKFIHTPHSGASTIPSSR